MGPWWEPCRGGSRLARIGWRALLDRCAASASLGVARCCLSDAHVRGGRGLARSRCGPGMGFERVGQRDELQFPAGGVLRRPVVVLVSPRMYRDRSAQHRGRRGGALGRHVMVDPEGLSIWDSGFERLLSVTGRVLRGGQGRSVSERSRCSAGGAVGWWKLVCSGYAVDSAWAAQRRVV